MKDPGAKQDSVVETTTARASQSRPTAFAATMPIAQRTLGRLLLEPPRAMPPAAEAERSAMKIQERAEGARLGFRAFVSYLLAFPLMFAVGVKSWALVGGGGAIIVLAALLTRWMHKERKVGTGPFALVLTLAAIIVLFQGTWLGPFVLMPMAACITMSVFALYGDKRQRSVIFGIGGAMIILPFLSELVPGIPRGYSFEGGNVVLHPRALELPPMLTTIGIVYTSIVLRAAPGVLSDPPERHAQRRRRSDLPSGLDDEAAVPESRS